METMLYLEQVAVVEDQVLILNQVDLVLMVL